MLTGSEEALIITEGRDAARSGLGIDACGYVGEQRKAWLVGFMSVVAASLQNMFGDRALTFVRA